MHITSDATVIPLQVGTVVMRVVEIDLARLVVRVAVGGPGEIPAPMRVRLPRSAEQLPAVDDVVRFDGLRVELVTMGDRCRVLVRADGVGVVDRAAA